MPSYEVPNILEGHVLCASPLEHWSTFISAKFSYCSTFMLFSHVAVAPV